jgi:hypothetical protein
MRKPQRGSTEGHGGAPQHFLAQGMSPSAFGQTLKLAYSAHRFSKTQPLLRSFNPERVLLFEVSLHRFHLS